jgi:hypothetical protein
MKKLYSVDEQAQNIGYFPFIDPDEKTILTAHGILENTVSGILILTNKKLFFYFYSNITRDKKFIATYPYIVSVDLKEGLFYSTLIVRNKKESFIIQKLKKKDALEFYKILKKIILENKK